MNEQFTNNTVKNNPALKKLLADIYSLLFFVSCLLTALMVASRSSFKIEPEVKTEGWGKGKAYISVSISDKVTGGKLCYSYNGDVFNVSGVLNSDAPVRNVLSLEAGQSPIMSEAKYAKLQEITMEQYKNQATTKALVFSGITAALYILRRHMKNKTVPKQ